jgi:hypothetical protein
MLTGLVNDKTLAEIELIGHIKMEQLKAYKKEYTARFSK